MLSRQFLLALTPTRTPARASPKRGFLALPNREEGLPVFGIIGANLAVFGGWYYAESKNDLRLYKFMQVKSWATTRIIFSSTLAISLLNDS
jgi:hypothetical protein